MDIKFNANELPDLPAVGGQDTQYGLAGAVAGIISDELVITGGSNFPNTFPWLGGTKTYYADIYTLDLKQTDTGWKVLESKLKEPLAYPACISVSNSIYCVGGENKRGEISSVIKIVIDNGKLQVLRQSNFPVAVSNSGITSISNRIYVFGGVGETGAVSTLYSTDISYDTLKWEKHADFPYAISHSVIVSQWDGKEYCLYVLGGRSKAGTQTDFFSAVWKYSPSNDKWSNVGNICSTNGKQVKLAAGPGAAVGKKQIFVFGGDDGILFNKIEDFINQISLESDPKKKQAIIEAKNLHLSGYSGFRRDIFVFNTLTNKCSVVAQLPMPSQVTTTVIPHGNKYIIPNGEIRPGTRTPSISCISIEESENN
ncbi:MAG: hypothetical protein ACK5IQ_00595 [Bacteroidales bacterium]